MRRTIRKHKKLVLFLVILAFFGLIELISFGILHVMGVKDFSRPAGSSIFNRVISGYHVWKSTPHFAYITQGRDSGKSTVTDDWGFICEAVLKRLAPSVAS